MTLLPFSFIPHGHCYLWQTNLVSLHVASDSLIALAYYSIPATLLYFVNKRRDIPFPKVFFLFGAFIIACGMTHVMGVWTLWYPNYWLSGGIKAITALISCYTALALIPLIPQALALPSPAQLEAANQALETQIRDRQQAEAEVRSLNTQLEQRVNERTKELQAVNHQLAAQIQERIHAEDKNRQGEFILVNQALADAYNTSVEHLLGRNEADVTPIPEQVHRFRADDVAVIDQRERILVAEDNAVNQQVVLQLLHRMGYRADVAGNGLEVIEALHRQPYDVVLMDVQMPEQKWMD